MSCCAPCSAAALKRLKDEERDFVVLFYNPNIFPKAEYDKRLAEQIKLCEKLGAEYKVLEYERSRWIDCTKGLEAEPERGKRCFECFKMRFARGAKWAREKGYGEIASVFGASPHKDQNQVDSAARAAIASPHVAYRDMKFPYAPEPDAYRQNYCGCEYSMRKK